MNQAVPTDQRICQTCIYFKAQHAADGVCHRFPPQFAGEDTPNEAHRWKFPWVGHHAWCGEFQLGDVPP